MRKYHTVGIVGCFSLALAAGTVGTSMTATAQPTTTQTEAAAAAPDCDSKPDWHEAAIAPGDENYNPKLQHPMGAGVTSTQLWQRHVALEDTYAVINPAMDGVRGYIEDMKTGQKCWATDEDADAGKLRAGYLDNRNTSVRVVVMGPQGNVVKGKWYREDAGGHRQTNAPAPGEEVIDGKSPGEEDPEAKADYDSHVQASGGDKLPDEYSVRYKSTKASISYKGGDTRASYAHATSDRKGVKVYLDSDKYGPGAARTLEEAYWWKGHKYEGKSGVLYNQHDALRVCIEVPERSGPQCGKWHRS